MGSFVERRWPEVKDTSVTAVIPAYNAERFLAEAIKSVLAQTHPVTQIIVVDDGSHDGTREVAEGFSEVQYLRKANEGTSSARNLALGHATGDFVAFLDADDVWVPEKTALQVAEFIRDPELALVYSGLFVADEALTPIYRIDPGPGRLAFRKTLHLEKPFMTGIGSSAMVPRWLVDEFDPMFDMRLAVSHDWAFACKVASKHRVEAVARPLFLYRQHGYGQTHRNLDQIQKDVELFLSELDPGVLATNRISRKRVRANLHLSLAFGYLRDQEWTRAAEHLIRSVVLRPDRLPVAILSHLSEIRQRRKNPPSAGA